MKKIFIAILLAISIKGASQPVVGRSGSANTVMDSRWMGQYNMFVPRYADTVFANLQKGIDTCGALIFTYDYNGFWYRQCSPKKWVQIFANSPSPSSDTLVWKLSGNAVATRTAAPVLGTTTADNLNFITDNQQRMIIPSAGITRNTAAVNKYLLLDTVTKNLYYGDGGSSSTPTWQQTLTAGSTLTTNNTILAGSTLLKIRLDEDQDFTGFEGLNYQSLIGFQNGNAYVRMGNPSGINGGLNAATGGATIFGQTAGSVSQITTFADSIKLYPHLGRLFIDTLTNLSTQNTLLGWKQGSGQGQVGYVTLGTGLSLSSGVLSNSGVTSTPTWQQTLTAGSTITSDVNITSGTQDINWVGTTGVWDQSMEAFGWTASKSGRNSVLSLTNDSISINPGFGNIHIDTLLNKSNQNALMGWDSTGTDRGQVGYVTLGSGLSLSSGVLNTSGTVPTPISSLTAATGSNSINNGSNAQTWNWPTLTNGIGLLLTSLASTTGTTGGSVLTVLRSGSLANASQTTYGAIIQNQHTGTTETNVGLKVEATGATNNYALIVPSGSGNVGIGTATPATTFHVAGSLRFVTGNQGAGKVMVSDGSGNADWAATSTLSGLPYWPLSVGATLTGNVDMDMNSNTFSLTNASGNGTTFSITDDGGGSAYFDNTAHDIKLGVNTATPSYTLTVQGSIGTGEGLNYGIFADGGQTVVGDWNSNLNGTQINVDDNAQTITLAGNVGIGTASPNSTLQNAGSFAGKYTSTATGITLDATNYVVNVTATGQTITLPTAVGIEGRIYTIKLTASGSCTVATTSSQTIDAGTTYSLASQYKYVTVMSDNANWIVIGNN